MQNLVCLGMLHSSNRPIHWNNVEGKNIEDKNAENKNVESKNVEKKMSKNIKMENKTVEG